MTYFVLNSFQMENIISGIKESNLKLTLAFGIGLHHAGLHERDRKTVEELFVNQKIQVCASPTYSHFAYGLSDYNGDQISASSCNE